MAGRAGGDELALVGRALAGERRVDVGAVELVDVAAEDLDDFAAEDLDVALAEPVGERLVDEPVALVAVDVGDRHAERVELALRQREQRLALERVARRWGAAGRAVERSRKGHERWWVPVGAAPDTPGDHGQPPARRRLPRPDAGRQSRSVQARIAPDARMARRALRGARKRGIRRDRPAATLRDLPGPDGSERSCGPVTIRVTKQRRTAALPTRSGGGGGQRASLPVGPVKPNQSETSRPCRHVHRGVLPAASANVASSSGWRSRSASRFPAPARSPRARRLRLPSIGPVPIDFILFGLTLLGVALFHHHTLKVALVGLAIVITLYKLTFTGFKEGPGIDGFAHASRARVGDRSPISSCC